MNSPLNEWIVNVAQQLQSLRQNPVQNVAQFKLPALHAITAEAAIAAIMALPEPPNFRATLERHMEIRETRTELAPIRPADDREPMSPRRQAYLKNVWHMLPDMRNDALYNFHYLPHLFIIMVHSGLNESENCTIAAYMLLWERRIMTSQYQHCTRTFQREFAEVFADWMFGLAELKLSANSDTMFCCLVVMYESLVAAPLGTKYRFYSDLPIDRYYELGQVQSFTLYNQDKEANEADAPRGAQVFAQAMRNRQYKDGSLSSVVAYICALKGRQGTDKYILE